MKESEKKKLISFPPNFFSSLKVSHEKINHEDDKPFEWSKSVLEGKTKVKIVATNKKKASKNM